MQGEKRPGIDAFFARLSVKRFFCRILLYWVTNLDKFLVEILNKHLHEYFSDTKSLKNFQILTSSTKCFFLVIKMEEPSERLSKFVFIPR